MSTAQTDDPVRPRPALDRRVRWAVVIGVLVILAGVGTYSMWASYAGRRQALDVCTAAVDARIEASGAGAYTVTSVTPRDHNTYAIAGLIDIADETGVRAVRDFDCTVVDGRLDGFAIRLG